MDIPLSIHLIIHCSLAIFSGYLAGRYFKKMALGILVGFCAGFLIDLDHVLEYFLVYGLSFNLSYFLQGRQFLVSDHIYLWFHAWEYVAVFILAGLVIKKNEIVKTILITIAFAMAVHLLTDTVINKVPLKFYTLSYRASRDFSAPRLMSANGYQENLKLKMQLGL